MTEGQLFSVFLADSFRILFGWGPELQAFRKPVSDVSDCDHHEWVLHGPAGLTALQNRSRAMQKLSLKH